MVHIQGELLEVFEQIRFQNSANNLNFLNFCPILESVQPKVWARYWGWAAKSGSYLQHKVFQKEILHLYSNNGSMIAILLSAK